mgnify:CR=1 FL=1
MEELFAYAYLVDMDLISGEIYEDKLNELFLKNPTDEHLLELEFLRIVSSLVRNFVPEKSRKSIMLRQTESPFEVLLNRHSYSNDQFASHLNTQADSLLSVLYKNPLKGKCRQQRSAFEFHG